MKRMILFLLVCFSGSLFGEFNFIFIGPPGSGKGTLSSAMVKTHGYEQICPGDILRKHIKQGTDLGKTIKPIVANGDYVDDEVVFRIIEEKITHCLDGQRPFIIDGFPRSVSGVEFLNEFFKNKAVGSEICCLHFVIDDKTCLDRICYRLVCFNCSCVFNKNTKKPKVDMVCDNCGHKLEARLGDSRENTLKRLAYYRKNIEPMVELIGKSFKVVSLDSDDSLENILKKHKNVFELNDSSVVEK